MYKEINLIVSIHGFNSIYSCMAEGVELNER